MKANPRGFMTQCDSGGWTRPEVKCHATTRLAKPARWRCADCEKRHGKIKEEE